MPVHPFQPGRVYHRRRDIHQHYKGQQYGGIATPAEVPFVFLFTSEAGEEFGYEDRFQADGLYWYTGEGQTGDMQMQRGNAAIVHHQTHNKSLLLFESAGNAEVRFVGEMAYLEHHVEQRPDKDGALRQALVFHLALLPEPARPMPRDHRVSEAPSRYAVATSTLDQLRQNALQAVSPSASVAERRMNVTLRAKAIKAYALARAQGQCEGCRQPAPFATKKGPFLEVHHVDRLADGGPDHPYRVIALCPNCHRKSHYAIDAALFNESLKDWLAVHEH